MKIRQVTVLGGSGFVGSVIVHKLSTAGYSVKVLTRRRERAKHLILLPDVQVVECNVMDDPALSGQIQGSDAVINLIGILHESGECSFDRVHTELPGRVADICRTQGVRRLLHMSALKAGSDAPSAYLRSKAAGEAAVMLPGDKLQVTIFRPSVIFGRGDRFLNLFAKLVRLFPVILLARPEARFQPVFVEDVAQAFVNSLDNVSTFGMRYDLCGPKIYTLRQLVQLVAAMLGCKRLIIGLNDRLSYLQAFVMEHLPGQLMTRDNLLSMQVDNVCTGEFSPELGIQLTSLEAIVPEYLANDTPRNAYHRFRGLAGR